PDAQRRTRSTTSTTSATWRSSASGWKPTYPNVHPVGGNGMHRYNNQDHSMLTAMLSVENILDGTSHDIWSVNVEEECHEENSNGGDKSGERDTGRSAPVLPRQPAATADQKRADLSEPARRELTGPRRRRPTIRWRRGPAPHQRRAPKRPGNAPERYPHKSEE